MLFYNLLRKNMYGSLYKLLTSHVDYVTTHAHRGAESYTAATNSQNSLKACILSQFSCRFFSLFWKFLRIFATDYDSSAVVTEDEFFQNHKRNAYAELNVSNMKRAMGGNISPIHIKYERFR